MLNNNIKHKLENIKNGVISENYKKIGNNIIPDDWTLEAIDNLVHRIKKPVKVDLTSKYKQIGIRSHGKGIFYKDEVTGLELKNKAVFWIEPECFIVNIVFAWELAVGKTTEKEIGMVGSHRFPMYKPVKDKIDLDYLTYFFKSPWGKNLLELASPGGAGRNKTLGQKEFLSLRIPVPPINEQQKISKILFTWDRAIELKERLIKESKIQKKGIMSKLVTGEVRLPGFKYKWKEETFEKCFKLISVKKNQIKSDEYKEVGKYPVVDQGKSKIIGYSDNVNKLFECPKTGVIVFGDHTRELKFINFNFIVGADGVQVLKSNEKFNIKFLYYQLQSKNIPNTGYNRHFKFVKEMVFFIPQIEEQEAIAKILSTFDNAIELLEQELQYLKLQKKGLMQLLLRGIVRV